MPLIKFTTPEVPSSIRDLRHPGYRNIYEYNLGNQNLWGTETLLGDWDGEFLLVAKDFYPSSYIEDAIRRGVPQPYRHKPGIPTNRNLIKTLEWFNQITSSSPNTSCGFLFVSACFLLRDDGLKSGPLPGGTAVLQRSHPALKFTVDNMPRLKHTVLMGEEALSAVQGSPLLDQLQRLSVPVHCVSHPARALTDKARFAEWETVFGSAPAVRLPPVAVSVGTAEGTSEKPAITSRERRLLVRGFLNITPKSAEVLRRSTGLSGKEVRNAIDSLRREWCVWHSVSLGAFWVDDPIQPISTASFPEFGSRWSREPGEDLLD